MPTPRIAAFRPGLSPPAVRMPIVFAMSPRPFRYRLVLQRDERSTQPQKACRPRGLFRPAARRAMSAWCRPHARARCHHDAAPLPLQDRRRRRAAGRARARSAISGPASRRSANGGRWGLEVPDMAALRRYRLARLRAQLAERRLCRHRGRRPDQHPLRHRQRQHAGLVPAQPGALRLRRHRRAGDRLRLPRLRASVGAARAGRRGPPRARLVLLQERRSGRRARPRLGRRARRSGARPWRRQPPARARQGRSRRRRGARRPKA